MFKIKVVYYDTPSPRGGKPLEYEVQNLLKIFTLVIFLPYYCGTLTLFYFSRVEVLKIIFFFRHHPLLYESFIYINNMDTALEIKNEEE